MFKEYNEAGNFLRQGNDKAMLVNDTREFGGCVIDEDGSFAGGSEWVFDSYFKGKNREET